MFRLRILDRHIIREILTPFFLSISALTLVLFLQRIYRLVELIISKGATVSSTAKLFVYVMPSFLVLTIPMSFLVATLTAFTQLSSDSEVTAMKASRFSLYNMIRPVMLLAVLAFAVTTLTSLIVAPQANHALKVHLFNMVKSRAMVGIEPGVFSSTFDGMVIYVDKMESLDKMQGIFISDERSARDPAAIVARGGRLIADPESLKVTLAMQQGSILTLPRDEQSYSTMDFDSGNLYLDISHALIQRGPLDLESDEISSLELYRQLKRARQEGKPTIDMESELHKRLSIPFACLLFGLIGAPLGIRRSRSGKSAGVSIALLVVLLYYVVLAAGTNLSNTGKLSPAVAYWLPNVLMMAAAGLLVYKKGHEIDFRINHRIGRLYQRLRGKKPPSQPS
jgi:lipopolysaccharide export system permease protein